ncbi:hypothetical protein BG004_006538 [Podila humilis]|nr:hypothetical protein BG004_006538 [Podila humilis]
MLKSSAILLMISVSAVLLNGVEAGWARLYIKNNAGKEQSVVVASNSRACACLKNTQTNSIRASNGGVVKLFSNKDCTGNFKVLGKNSMIKNAQWVNSASWGADGIPSWGGSVCDDLFE